MGSIPLKVDFDRMKQFPGRLFLEAYSGRRELTLEAREHLVKLGIGKAVSVLYDKLLIKH